MGKLTKLELFTPEECDVLADRVFSQAAYFMDRNGFWTLGASAYLDDIRNYAPISNAFNKILADTFPDMYAAVSKQLHAHFGTTVGPASSGLAYPGFHIFNCQSKELQGNIHIDEPYRRIELLKDIEWTNPFSFTVPLALPEAGGGIDFWWDFTDEDIETFIGDDSIPAASYVPYEIGKMYVHDGLTPHRIANREPIPEGQARVTLQGHGVMTEHGAIAYF